MITLGHKLRMLSIPVLEDGVVTPGESSRIAWLLREITVERVKRRRLEQAIAARAGHDHVD